MRVLSPEQKSNVCVLTGAGISAESGVPTFRGSGSTLAWKGMPVEVISSAAMLRKDLREVWAWFDHRRAEFSHCGPNPAHYALAAIEAVTDQFLIATQNIDGLHRRAGSHNIVELHGNINRARCIGCGKSFELAHDCVPHDPSHCDECKTEVRPDVVLFGEMLPDGVFEKGLEAASQCGVFLLVGTSAIVYPAAMLPQAAKEAGAYLIEVNPEETALSGICDESYRSAAGEALPLIANEIWNADV